MKPLIISAFLLISGVLGSLGLGFGVQRLDRRPALESSGPQVLGTQFSSRGVLVWGFGV